jgi:putative peptide zinc metalloprotease protein
LPKRPEAPGRLESWSGTPLEPKNLGAFLPESVLFCQIGNPKKMEAHLVIEQDYIDFVRIGDTVEIKLDQFPWATFNSKIDEIGPDLKVAPRQLSSKAGGELVTKTDETTGVERPANTSYPARAAIDHEEAVLAIGLRGQGKIHARWQTLGQRFWRYFKRTFNFKL